MSVIYVAGSGHSGSTLLDQLLGGHRQVLGAGELKVLARSAPARCTCGARSYGGCAFWHAVEKRVRELEGVGLDELDLEGADPKRFPHHNRALFRALREVSGRRFVVDSSKSVARLAALLACDDLGVLPIHLVRDPVGVVVSNVRKERSWWRAAVTHRRLNDKIFALLAEAHPFPLRYERLVAEPERVLTEILARMGLSLEPRQLDWADRTRHNIGGNRMRWSGESTIRLDRSWEGELGPVRERLIRRVAGPWAEAASHST